MRVPGDWLHRPGPLAVLELLTGAGHQALVVGGCVRNALLGVPISDIDIATSAPPDVVTALAEGAGHRAVPTGIAHGTVTVIAQDETFEVTTFRHDSETFGRHARVTFGADIAQDAARRDFTMNALYAQADGTLVDPLGGLPDLLARRLRFVGDPRARITEDYLRILRFFRFHAQYGDPAQGLDPDALDACARHLDGLATLSAERVTAELRKLLSARDPAPAVAAMAQTGVLAQVLPGAVPGMLGLLVHAEDGAPSGWLARLAVIGGTPQRLTNAESRDLDRLRAALGSADAPAALGWRLGAALARDAVLARAAVLEAAPPPDWQAEVARGVAVRFPLTAADLMPGLQGPALGAALAQAQEHWLAQGLHPDRAALLRRLGLASGGHPA